MSAAGFVVLATSPLSTKAARQESCPGTLRLPVCAPALQSLSTGTQPSCSVVPLALGNCQTAFPGAKTWS